MIRPFLLLLLMAAIFCQCAPAYKRFLSNYQFQNDGAPDYSSLNYWAAHPYKWDPSDSVPRPLQSDHYVDSTVDVFFLHPTTFTDRDNLKWNADINDADLNAKTDYSTILYQASAFNKARLFAPRYRQANIKAYFSTDTVAAQRAFDQAYEDIRTAFRFYLDQLNKGRPIVVASHSQGTTHAIRLLKEFFDGQPLERRLVVAYLIGMNIPANSFTSLKACMDSVQTGCFCGWRTFRRGFEVTVNKFEESFVTNPLTWTTGNEHADESLNKGAILRSFNTLYHKVTDAQIHKTILWVERPRFPGSFLYRKKNYHIGDINLFYVNIAENMRQRIGAYWKP